MGAVSSFGWKMQADREELCSKLVCRLLPVQADDSNHDLAMDYCLQNLERHRFGDVDPVSVESLYAGLSERLGSHSQLGKQRALSKLVTALLACKLDSQQLEPHHNLLSLVYWLARRPLESVYIPLEEARDSDAGSQGSGLSEGDNLSDWGNDAAVYSIDSELSDWEQPEDSDAESVSSADTHQQAAQLAAADTAAQQHHSPLDLIRQLREKLAVHLPKSQQTCRLQKGCLFLSVAAALGSEDALPSATHCTTEADLAQQVIRMLRGAHDPGSAFSLDRREGSFSVMQHTHVPHMSHRSLLHMLNTFAAAGTDLLRLQSFVTKVQCAVSSQSWQASVAQSTVSPTLAAFAAALADHMHPMWAELVSLEEGLGLTEPRGVPAAHATSLLKLECELQGIFWRIGLMKHVWEEALTPQGQPRDTPLTAAQLSCDLLTNLKVMLHHYSLQGGPRGGQETAMVLQILHQSMQPLLAALQAWLYQGLLQGAPHNFFIHEDQSVSVDSPYFWNEAYTLRQTATGEVACPAFLQPLVAGILSTGKSLLLLRAHQSLHNRSSAPDVKDAIQGLAVGKLSSALQHLRRDTRGSLSERFLHKLRHSVQSRSMTGANASTGSALGTDANVSNSPGTSAAATASNSPGPSLGQKMAQTQASWQPLPFAAWPLITSTAPSAAAYPMPKHHSRRAGLQAISAQPNTYHCQQRGSQSLLQPPSQSEPESQPPSQPPSNAQVSAGSQPETSPHPPAFQASEHAPEPGRVASHTQQTDTGQPGHPWTRPHTSKQGGGDTQTGLQHSPIRPQQRPTAADSPSAQMQDQLSSEYMADEQQAAIRAADDASTSGAQTIADPGSHDSQLQHQPQQQLHQQPQQQQQQSPHADGSVLEWCSRADELLQQSGAGMVSAPVEAGSVRVGMFSNLQRGLTRLPAYSGKGMFCMTKQHNSPWEDDRHWLDNLQEVDLPPVDSLINDCLIHPIQEQVDMVGSELLARLLGQWGLMHQLTILRNVFLLGCPLLMPFAAALYGRLHKGQKLSSISHFELEVMLQQSLADQPPHRPGDHALPPPDTLSVELVHHDPAASAARGSRPGDGQPRCHVAELLPLRLHYKVPWPLSMIVDDAMLVKYNSVLTFLLQVRWAKWSLERVQVKAGRGEAGRPLEPGDVLAHQLSHFVNTLHQFVMDRLLHGAWLELEQALESAKSLEEVTAAHSRFVVAVQRQCLLAPDKTWKLIEVVVVQILNQVLHFAELQQKLRKPGTKVSVADVRAELAALHARFKDRHRYLLKVLTAKTLKIGGQSELHYLVMCITFNDFYAKTDDQY